MLNVSIIEPAFVILLGAVTAAAIAGTWFRVGRRWLQWTVRGLAVLLPILMSAVAINARYAYFPTLGALFGRNAADQVSFSQLPALEHRAGLQIGGRGLRLAISGGVGARVTLMHGIVVPFTIPATRSHFRARTALVYLPPAYFDVSRPQLPVIELLHGTPGSPADWTRAGFADVTADRFAADHGGYAPVLVMADVNGRWFGDTECVNGNRGQAQTYLTADVRTAVIRRFHTRTDRYGWAIAGLSEGGYCALQIGLRHPDLYGAIGDFSGNPGPSIAGGLTHLFTGTRQQIAAQHALYDPVNLLTHWTRVTRPPIWFEVGTIDTTLANCEHLDQLAQAHRFDTRFVIQPGSNHSYDSWRQAFQDALPGITASFGEPPAFQNAYHP